MDSQQPFSYAHVCLIEGEQGGGKSNTGVARAIEVAIDNIVAVKRIDDEAVFKAAPLSFQEKKKLEADGYRVRYDTIKMLVDNKIKIMNIPPKHIIIPSINIFYNLNLYGVKYYHLTISQIIEWLDLGYIRDGRLLIDEYQAVGGARDSMTSLGKTLQQYSFTYRKRHLDVDIMCHHQRLADWTSKLVVTEHIYCTYDEDTNMVTATIKKKKQPEKKVSYDGSLYWKYFRTDQLPQLPASRVGKAIAQAR